jgi:hypothetical protein
LELQLLVTLGDASFESECFFHLQELRFAERQQFESGTQVDDCHQRQFYGGAGRRFAQLLDEGA